MNDTSVSSAVRNRLTEVHGSLTDVHMNIPVAVILDQARRQRRARRGHAALVVVAGTGGCLALAAVLMAAGRAPRTVVAPAQLTAWTVSRQATGEVTVTIRELKDPAGLQRELRSYGVPANVTFASKNPRSESTACLGQIYPASAADMNNVFPPESPSQLHRHVAIVIRPSALPSRAGVEMSFDYTGYRGTWGISENLVYASPGCTGT